MAEAKSSTIENLTAVEPHTSRGSSRRSSSFKYYIHDSVTVCRLQLLGELSEADLGELDGCWQTIKTTLSRRRLVLDLRGLNSTDNAGSGWLTSMASEGATYLPDSYFAGEPNGLSETQEKRKLNPFARVLGMLRGACTASVD